MERRDYDEAAALVRLQGVVTPRPGGPLTVAECAPQTLEEQYDFFLEAGFCVILGTLEGEQLERAQAAFLRREDPARRAYEESRSLAPPVSAEDRLRLEGEKPSQLFGADGEPILRADGSPVSHGAYRTFFDNDELAEEDDVFVDLIDNPKTAPGRA